MPFSLLQTFNLSPIQITQFEKLLTLYQEWNAKINLSSIEKKEEILIKHFYDSLLVTELEVWKKQNLKVIDLGTGGGFPLLPLAIVASENLFWGVDSVQKKITVIQAICEKLALKNVKTSSERVEILGQAENFRENFDLVVTRAFAKWHTLLELALPLVKIGGKLVAYQGPQILEELEASEKILELLGGKIQELSHFELPENMGERILVTIEKTHNTPIEFPRAIGIPKKTPL